MLLILDIDFTLNRIDPPGITSFRELAPPEIAQDHGPAFWAWLTDHLKQVDYAPNPNATAVVRALMRHASQTVVCTGRPEALRNVTQRWLERHFDCDGLFMRADGDCRHNEELKRDHLRGPIASMRDGDEPIYAFEDDLDAIRMYEEEGVRTFTAPACWPALLRNIARASDADSVRALMRQQIAG
jgi:hypothetical protein